MSDPKQPFRDLPSWPKEAKDLPGDGPLPGPPVLWRICLPAIGVAVGLGVGLGDREPDLAGALGQAAMYAVVGLLIGYGIDRTQGRHAVR